VTVPDAVVIGAGPNGLTSANVLADAGWSVTVVEGNAQPGGAVRTDEVTAPGFKNDLFSAFYPLAAASPALRALDLEAYGLRWSRSPLALGNPTAGGPTAIIAPDIDATAASLDEFAPGDGDAWRALYRQWERVGDALVDSLLTPFPPVRAGARLARRVGRAGLLDFARFGLLPVRRMADEEFDGAGGGLLLAGCALHTDLGPDSTAGGLFGWLLCGLAQQIGFPVPEGGAQSLIDALVRRLEARGGSVVLGQRVARIEVRSGRAVAVETVDGSRYEASRAVLADVGAPALYLDLVGREHLPARLVDHLERRFQYGDGTVKLDWALDGPIPWSDSQLGGAGTVHLADSLDDLTVMSSQLARDLVPSRPFLVVGQMTTADPTRSPEGTEAAWAYAHVPRDVAGDAGPDGIRGKWDDQDREAFVARMEDRIEAHAPGFRQLIRARHVMTPPDLESANPNLVGGEVNGGTAHLHQQLVFRPTPGLGRPETPVEGLFLASASAHPGGGVHGACGANAAQAALAAERPVAGLVAKAAQRLVL